MNSILLIVILLVHQLLRDRIEESIFIRDELEFIVAVYYICSHHSCVFLCHPWIYGKTLFTSLIHYKTIQQLACFRLITIICYKCTMINV